MNGDGSSQKRLTVQGKSYAGALSPDGTRIAYDSASSPDKRRNYQIYAMNVDGSDQVNITRPVATIRRHPGQGRREGQKFSIFNTSISQSVVMNWIKTRSRSVIAACLCVLLFYFVLQLVCEAQVSLLGLASPAAAAPRAIAPAFSSQLSDNPRYAPGEVLVKLKDRKSPGGAAGILARQSLAKVGEIPEIQVLKVGVPQGKELENAVLLGQDADVEYAEPNYYVSYSFIPHDTYYATYQWNLARIGMSAAWSTTLGSPSIRVAVVDTGIDYGHPDRPTNLTLGPDYGDGDADPFDTIGHGTHVAGILAAATNNGRGVAGVAPGSSVLAVKVFNSTTGSASQYAVANGITYATDWGAKVINLSLGGQWYLQVMQDAVNYALSNGRLVVAAAGNDYDRGNPISYPAAFPGVMAVAATGPNDEHAHYSEAGDWVSIAAPGGDTVSSGFGGILSTVPAGSYAGYTGTSMAAPHVSGLAALIWSVNPNLTSAQVRSIIESTSVDLGTPCKDPLFGYGRIDAAAAVAKAVTASTPNSPTTNPSVTYKLYLPLVFSGYCAP